MILRIVLLTICFLVVGMSLTAQTPRTIQEIRQVVDVLTDDRSVLEGEQVVVEGVVVTDPNDWYQAVEATRRFSFWIQEAGVPGPEHGLQVRLNQGTPANVEATGILNLRRGMRVRLVGEVAYFSGEIQINLATDRPIEILDENFPLVERPVFDDLSLFTNLMSGSQLLTATEWEGTYLTVRNLRVINVNSAANPNRGHFTVEDEVGNTIIVWDAHRDMRRSQNGWEKPQIEDIFSSISGILYHRAFPPQGSPPGTLGLPGTYELHPWSPQDLVKNQTPQSYKILTSSFRVCAGNTVELSVVMENGDPLPPGVTVRWQPADLVVDPGMRSTYTQPLSRTTTFSAEINDGIGTYTETIEIQVVSNRLRIDVFEALRPVDDRREIILLARGGQRPYEYSIDGGNNFLGSSRFRGLGPGNFQLMVVDANGCIAEREYELR